MGVGADVRIGVGVYRTERAKIVVIHIGAAGTSRWRETRRERHKIEHGRDLSGNKTKGREKREREKEVTSNEEEGRLTTLILSLSGNDTSLPYDTEDAGESGGGYKSGTGLTLVVAVAAPCAAAPLSGTSGAEDARRSMDVNGALKRGCCAEDAERVLVTLIVSLSISTSVALRISLRPLSDLAASASAPRPCTPCSETNTPSVTLLMPLSLSQACTALESATPFTPRATSSAICAQRRSCMIPRVLPLHRPRPPPLPTPPPPPQLPSPSLLPPPLGAAEAILTRLLSRVLGLRLRRGGGRSLFLSLVFRFAMASTLVPGLKRQSGYRARCSACACTARFSHNWRSAGGSVFQTIPKWRGQTTMTRCETTRTDDFGEGAVVALDISRYTLRFYE